MCQFAYNLSKIAILQTLPDDDEDEEWCAATAAEEADGGGTEVALADAKDPPPVMVILRLLTQLPKARHSKNRVDVSLLCRFRSFDDINCINCLLATSSVAGLLSKKEAMIT